MHITIKLFATLRIGHFDMETREFPSGTTIGEIIHLLGIPEDEVALIFVNGRHAEFDTRLIDGDMLGLFPPIGGG
jgi:sulfur-carrier protein